MTVDWKLTWITHMLELKKLFAKKLGLLKKSTSLLRSVCQDFYFKIILPSVTYGLIPKNSCSSNTYRLEKIGANNSEHVCVKHAQSVIFLTVKMVYYSGRPRVS